MTSTIKFGTGYDDRGKKITIDTREYSTDTDSVPEGHWKIGSEEQRGELTKKRLKDLLDGRILIDEIDEARKQPTTITVNNLRGGTNELEIVNAANAPVPDIDSILAFANNQDRVLKTKKPKKVTKKRKSAKKTTKKRKSAKKTTKKRKSAKKTTKKRKSAKKTTKKRKSAKK
jgi:hypothetical protein